jgi:hypothetical protein
MNRIRSPHLPPAHAPDEGATPVALSRLLEEVNSPSAARKDVDALLSGLERPLAADESPRERADFLLSVLNSRHVCSMKGSRRQSVQSAAVRAMMELGHPYALEIPPEALDGADQDARVRWEGRRIPHLGILLALIGTAPAVMLGPIGLALAVPTLLTLLGGALQLRPLQQAGLVMMGLLSAGLVLLGGWFIVEDLKSQSDPYDGMGHVLGALALAPVPFLAAGAFLLRHPEWRPDDAASEEDASR